MSDPKPCGTCGLMAVGTNGVAMTDQKKWLTAPSPCPECMEEANKHFAELGRKFAQRVEIAVFAALDGKENEK